MLDVRRREFITLLGGAAAWPLAARAQQSAIPVIGFLNHGSAEQSTHLLAAFRKGLSETGYVEGQNVSIEYRWANHQVDRLPELAADLVRRRVSVIATPVSTPASLAAKAATTTIPVVFGVGTDPVEVGLVVSFNRPGGNVTGVSLMNWELGAKRVGLLHELLPAAARFALLIDPKSGVYVETFVKEVQDAAAAIGRQIDVLTASTNREIDTAFASLVQNRPDALLTVSDALFNARRVQLVALTLRHAVPAIFPWREAVEIGGLMSYGPSFSDHFRQVAIYTGRVLKGEKPADIPILRASKFELVINLQTAKTLDLDVPATLLASADEVIE
jgi:putative tryptophan/tyrosine transport system substrate-binding protein